MLYQNHSHYKHNSLNIYNLSSIHFLRRGTFPSHSKKLIFTNSALQRDRLSSEITNFLLDWAGWWVLEQRTRSNRCNKYVTIHIIYISWFLFATAHYIDFVSNKALSNALPSLLIELFPVFYEMVNVGVYGGREEYRRTNIYQEFSTFYYLFIYHI